MTSEPPDRDGPRATPGMSALSVDFYDEAEWTQVLVGIGERFRSRIDGKVLQAMLSEMLAAHTEFAAAATADRVRHDAALAAPGAADRISDKLSSLHSAVGDLEATYSTMGSGAGDAGDQKTERATLAAARAEAELIREQAVAMAESMIAAAADEAEQRRRVHDEEIAESRVATEAAAVKVLEEALADADFIRSSAEEASARTIAEAEASAEALRRAVVDEIAALRASAEADIAAQRAAHEAGRVTEEGQTADTDPTGGSAAEDVDARLDAAEADARAIRDEAEADARAIREAAIVDAPPDTGTERPRRRGLYRRRRVGDVETPPGATALDETPSPAPSNEAERDTPSDSYRRRRRGGPGV